MERKKSAMHRANEKRARHAKKKERHATTTTDLKKRTPSHATNTTERKKERQRTQKKGAMHITRARPQRHSAMQNRQKLEKMSSSRIEPVTSGD